VSDPYPADKQADYQQPNQGGYAPAPPSYGGYVQPQQGNGLAIAGLVCGIIGLFFLWIVLSPLAIIFGSIGRSRANRGASGKGMATAAIVLGIVGIVGYVILIAVLANRGFVL